MFTAQQAFNFVNHKVFAKYDRRLNDVETAIVLGTLRGKTYKQISKETGYSAKYLHHDIGPDVWELLRDVLGDENPAIRQRLQTKRNFCEVVAQSMEAELLTLSTEPSHLRSRILHGQLPDASTFFGRSEELARLAELIDEFRCVSVLGGAGIGKSALVSNLIQGNLPLNFKRFIWKSLRHEPSASSLLNHLVQSFNQNTSRIRDIETQLEILLKYLRTERTLIIIDSAEYLHERSRATPDEAEDLRNFTNLIGRLATEDHQSCLVLTSREPIRELLKLQQAGHSCRSYRIRGLDTQACVDLLTSQGLSIHEDLLSLILKYGGEPLDLNLAANYIQKYCGGSVQRFLTYITTLMSETRQENLDRLFGPDGRLSALERGLLIYISQTTEQTGTSLRFSEIMQALPLNFSISASVTDTLKALEFLHQCSLLELCTDASDGETYYEVQPTIQKYIRLDPSGFIKSIPMLQEPA